jgi:hypothetical protein
VIGGFVPPKDTQIPTGGAWEPIADTLEYDPGGRPPEAHGSGLLNGFQALAQETGVPVPKLDVVLVMLCST